MIGRFLLHASTTNHAHTTFWDRANIVSPFLLVLVTTLVWLATNNLVKESRKASELELRAYISFKGFERVSFCNPVGVVQQWRFDPIWENSGETFTQNFFNHISWKSYPTGRSPADENFPDLGSQIHTRILGGPKAIVRGETVTISASDLANLAQTQSRFFIWGWAQYNDVFHPKQSAQHRTQFCIALEILGDPTNTNCLFGFDFQTLYNGADGELGMS